MQAMKNSRSIVQDESLDAAYDREVARERQVRRPRNTARMNQESRRDNEARGTHLERGRSMVAPSPVGDAAWFI